MDFKTAYNNGTKQGCRIRKGNGPWLSPPIHAMGLDALYPIDGIFDTDWEIEPMPITVTLTETQVHDTLKAIRKIYYEAIEKQEYPAMYLLEIETAITKLLNMK